MAAKGLTVGLPVYGLSYDADRCLLAVVGGGGSSKSGVKNFLILYKVDSQSLELKELSRLSTGNAAPMCVLISSDEILCGVNDRCWIVGIEDEGKSLGLSTTFRSDFGSADPYQKSVITSDGRKVFCTIGTDPYLRIWSNGDLVDEFNAGNEIVGAVFLSDDDLAYTTSNALHIYNINAKESKLAQKCRDKFEFRNLVKSTEQLIAVESKKDRSGSTLMAFSLDGSRLLCSKTLPIKKSVTSLAVSIDGCCIAFGSADGTVGVLDASSFKIMRTVTNTHSFAVTSVQVLSFDGNVVLISGSADGTVKLTKIKPQSMVVFWLALFAILALLVSYLIQAYPQKADLLVHTVEDLIDQWLTKLQ